MGDQGIVIVRRPQIIKVQSAFPILPEFVNYSFTLVENGTTVFTLPAYPVLTGLFSANIDGVTQDPLHGDYTINGNLLTIAATDLVIGQKVAGFFQKMGSNVNPTVLNYRTFFFIATNGQTVFTLPFTPIAVLYVAVNGIIEGPNDFTVNGPIITLTAPLNSGDQFYGLAIQS